VTRRTSGVSRRGCAQGRAAPCRASRRRIEEAWLRSAPRGICCRTRDCRSRFHPTELSPPCGLLADPVPDPFTLSWRADPTWIGDGIVAGRHRQRATSAETPLLAPTGTHGAAGLPARPDPRQRRQEPGAAHPGGDRGTRKGVDTNEGGADHCAKRSAQNHAMHRLSRVGSNMLFHLPVSCLGFVLDRARRCSPQAPRCPATTRNPSRSHRRDHRPRLRVLCRSLQRVVRSRMLAPKLLVVDQDCAGPWSRDVAADKVAVGEQTGPTKSGVVRSRKSGLPERCTTMRRSSVAGAARSSVAGDTVAGGAVRRCVLGDTIPHVWRACTIVVISTRCEPPRERCHDQRGVCKAVRPKSASTGAQRATSDPRGGVRASTHRGGQAVIGETHRC